MSSIVEQFRKVYKIWLRILAEFQHLFLLIIRVYWGYSFFQAGLGKFQNFDRTLGFFTDLGIPYPLMNTYMASGTEFLCGLFMLIGFGSRIITVPLIFTMCIAYLTAHQKELAAIFSDTDTFLAAPPFLYLLVSIIILLFGAGRYSIDSLFSRSRRTL